MLRIGIKLPDNLRQRAVSIGELGREAIQWYKDHDKRDLHILESYGTHHSRVGKSPGGCHEAERNRGLAGSSLGMDTSDKKSIQDSP